MKTEIFWINGLPKGRLGIASRPRGGDWLDTEVRAWRATGIDCVVSALTPAEGLELELGGEAAVCQNHGMEFEYLSIPDRGVPKTISSMKRLMSSVVGKLEAGETVLVHCRQGIGRASLIAASVLVSFGEEPESAFSRVESARGRPVPDTEEQRLWVRQFADALRNTQHAVAR
jgi:protein-tyrosine phosphatase